MALAALCLLGLFSTEIADTDFWWHLKTGQYVVERRALPAPDPFSYTSELGPPAYPGEERVRYFNLTHEWLAQALWYLVYLAGGFPAVVLFKAVLLTGFCGLAGLLAARRSGEFWWGMAAAGAAASLAVLFRSDRPALVTFLLVAVFIWILERGRPLWALPVLSVVWANSHGGFFLGGVIVGAYAVASRRHWPLAALTVAASGLNPSHFRIVEVLLAYRKSYLTDTLIEWTRPPLWGPPYMFPVLLYASAAALLLAWRRVRLSDWLLFAVFSAASLAAFRNVMLTALLAPVLIATYLPWRLRLPRLAAPAAAAALAAALGAGIWQGQFFQLRAALWKFPSGAADFLLARGFTEPIFNTYELGGYLIWRLAPRYKVFIDGRALNENVYRDYQQALGQADRGVLNRHHAGVIVVNAIEYVSGVVYPLVLGLANQAETEWQLVYEDPQALVFLRHAPEQAPWLDKSRIAGHLETACRNYIERDPELCLCARTLGFLFWRAGDSARARRLFALYLASPHDPDPEAEAAWRRLGP